MPKLIMPSNRVTPVTLFSKDKTEAMVLHVLTDGKPALLKAAEALTDVPLPYAASFQNDKLADAMGRLQLQDYQDDKGNWQAGAIHVTSSAIKYGFFDKGKPTARDGLTGFKIDPATEEAIAFSEGGASMRSAPSFKTIRQMKRDAMKINAQLVDDKNLATAEALYHVQKNNVSALSMQITKLGY